MPPPRRPTLTTPSHPVSASDPWTTHPARQRARAIQEGYRSATLVPFSTAERCLEAMTLCRDMAGMASPQMISDVGNGALMGHAGLKAVAYNVRINLPHIADEGFRTEIGGKLDALLADAVEVAAHVEERVEAALARKG